MIIGMHTMFYSSEPEALRAFIRDKLGLEWFDVGDEWLIFKAPETDIGCHAPDNATPSGTHHISFLCDDLEATVAELSSRGVEFLDQPADAGYGRRAHFRMPGDLEVELCQPYYRRG